MRDDQQLWRPEVQGRDPNLVAKEAQEAIGREWERVWELPIPFFREKYEAAGLSADEVPPLDAIPRTTKDDFRADEAAAPPFGRYRALGLEDAVRIGASTGTTGLPTLIFFGPNDLEDHIESGIRNQWRYGIRPGDRFTHSWPQGLYPTGVSGGRTYLDLGVLEIAVGPPFDEDAAAYHLRVWERLKPTGFMLTASQLETYLTVAQREGIDLEGMLDGAPVAFLEASCQFPGPRKRFESTYGFRLHNIGGASEIPGFSVSDCTHHTGLHVRGDRFVVQACDPETGVEVPEGERGHLVVTAFGLDAFCMRYDLQDIVTVTSGPCPCGETGPRYTLLGRGADAISIQGRSLLPIDIQLALDELERPPEFQVLGSGGEQQDVLRVRVETADGTARDAHDLLERHLEVPVEVDPVEVGSLPRSSFKPRRVSA